MYKNTGSFKDTHSSNFETSVGFKNLNSTMEGTKNSFDNLKVVIRVRPALPREMEIDLPFRSIVK